MGLRTVSLLALLAFAAAGASAQGTGTSRYEALYGIPVEVSIDDLVDQSASYEGRAVRTKGRVEIVGGVGRSYALRATFGKSLQIVPMAEVAHVFEGMRYLGHQVEVTGVFTARATGTSEQSPYVIRFWAFVAPEERRPGDAAKAPAVTLEALVSNPGRRDGQLVRVVGKFRGRNLFGDLPVKSQRSREDWVVKDDSYAVWVTGRQPKGSGWELDPSMRRDTAKWIEVVGRPETRNGITYLRALSVALTGAPTPTAQVQAPSPPPERPKAPPVVVFALPLDGESEIPANSRFVVQFSKDMDEATFDGRVFLRYVGPRRPGDREFDGVKLHYDRGRRALTVDPGDVLRAGRQVELVLMPGIADLDGLTLVSRPGGEVSDAVDVLRWLVGT